MNREHNPLFVSGIGNLRGGNPATGVVNGRAILDQVESVEYVSAQVQDILFERESNTSDYWRFILRICGKYAPPLGVASPVKAGEQLNKFRLELEKEAEIIAQELPPYLWLFYARRMPLAAFVGKIVTTPEIQRSLLENFSRRSHVTSKKLADESSGYFAPELNAGQRQQLARGLVLVQIMHWVHATIRRAGKGQTIRWEQGQFPTPIDDPVIEAEIELYDTRMANRVHLGSGTTIFGSTNELVVDGDIDFMASVVMSVSPVGHTLRAGDSDAADMVSRPPLSIIYGVGCSSLQPFIEVASAIEPGLRQGAFSRGAASVAILSRAVFELIIEGQAVPLQNLLGVGYCSLPHTALHDMLEKVLHGGTARTFKDLGLHVPASSRDLIDEVLALEARWWPAWGGSPLYRLDDIYLYDGVQGTRNLSAMLTIDQGATGSVVNSRAFHFEKVVQDAVDSSVLAPPEELRLLRGRPLRHNGKTITDLDAIAVIGNTLVAISCKSAIYTSHKEIGDYAAIRNMRTNINKFVKEWDEKIALINHDKKGDNYDFSDFEVLGIICMPGVEFMEIRHGIPAKARLPRVVSLRELEMWLESNASVQ